MDSDDDESIRATQETHRCIPGPSGTYSTAVRNWNAAAAISANDVLFVIADDLRPPPSWDTQLCEILGDNDPQQQTFAVKIRDSPDPNDFLLRHPVISRLFFNQYGLFDNEFHGVYCDNDISLRAYWKSVILDGRGIHFEHEHPATNHSLVMTESHIKMNRSEEYQHGESVLESRWPCWKIMAGVRPIRSDRRIVGHRRLLLLRAYGWSLLTLTSNKVPTKRKLLLLRDRAVQTAIYQRIRKVGV